MFDFGFGELLLLGVIALVVLGPERLPVAARLLGRWIRGARNQWNAVKAELENEIADEELRRSLREAADAVRQGAQSLNAAHAGLADAGGQMTTLAAARTDGADAATAAVHEAISAIDRAEISLTQATSDPAQLSLLDPAGLPTSDGSRGHG
ncbi:MAG: twin-arginine translocase subunit TatB [Proteobacteria bacterium]|nr:twin-arginine translocase subunit TatB [Pseudomonadota bacterium]